MELSISIPPDNEGYTGRECPECKKYFKIKFGTGIDGDVPCHCPYCNHTGSHDEFWTTAQIEYAESVAIQKISGDFLKSLKKLERKPNRNDFISIGITVKGNPTPITYYSEKELEEKVTCSNCTLEYTIYGTFGYCPDCGIHNSQQILFANFDTITKMLELAKNADSDIAQRMIENCLEDAVSSFDGYGRECTSKAGKVISFQNISGAKKNIQNSFGIDISSSLIPDDWQFVTNQFQKRHLLSHKMGIIDDEYIKKTNSNPATIGRKVKVDSDDVVKLINALKSISNHIHSIL